MDIGVSLVYRTFMLFAGAWLGLSSAFFIAFLWHGFTRMKPRRRHGETVVECPYCDGRGAVIDRFDEWAVCPMCDGEAALVGPRRELDEG